MQGEEPETGFQELLVLADVARLEFEQFSERDKLYRREFNREFADELAYLVSQDALPKEEKGAKIDGEDEREAVSKKTLKKMHRKLARLTHPDLTDAEDDTEFKKIQEAYEAGDVATIVAACKQHNVNVDLTALESRSLRKQIESRRQHVAAGMATAHWIWCESDKTDSIRRHMWTYMNIDPAEYEKWLSDNDIVVLKELKEDEILVSFSVE
tara:strand:+ start:2302 stop:2937 length:636 start_codon:yes stop_codon:yes gene_type:complete